MIEVPEKEWIQETKDWVCPRCTAKSVVYSHNAKITCWSCLHAFKQVGLAVRS